MRRGQMPPLHSHEVDEVFFVLEGTMIVHTGGQAPCVLEAGEALVAPSAARAHPSGRVGTASAT